MWRVPVGVANLVRSALRAQRRFSDDGETIASASGERAVKAKYTRSIFNCFEIFPTTSLLFFVVLKKGSDSFGKHDRRLYFD